MITFPALLELASWPFGQGDLTATGIQWSPEVDTGVKDTDVAVESVELDGKPRGELIEMEFGLTAQFRALFTGYATWAASTAYALNAFVVPTTHNNRIYECTTAGTSGLTQPTWPTTIGATVTDGTVTWTCRGIDVTYKWQAQNKGATWVNLHPAVTKANINTTYVAESWSGRFKVVAGRLHKMPIEVRLVIQSNQANQGRARTKNSSYVRLIWSVEG